MKQDRIKLSVLVPAYNEAENIEPLAREFWQMLQKTTLSGRSHCY
jgi:hypothetical protein